MALHKEVDPQNQAVKTLTIIDGQDDITKGSSTTTARLEELESLPHRNAVLHWAAFTLSLMSLLLLLTWVLTPQGPVPTPWILLDIGLGVVFAVEFFTRSGFRWGRTTYL